MYDSIMALSKHFVKLAKASLEFDLDTLKEFVNPNQIEAYMNMTNIPLVGGGKGSGIGSSRKVYDLGDKVLKLAYNQTGIAQNTMEARIQDSSPLFATIFDMHPKAIWILSEKITPFKPGEWEIVTGLPYNLIKDTDLRPLFYRLTLDGLEQLRIRLDLEDDAVELLKQIIQTRGLHDLIKGDLFDPAHWGRAPDGSIKVFDYGLDTSLYESHYDPSTGFLRSEPAGYGDPEPSASELEALREMESEETATVEQPTVRPGVFALSKYFVKKHGLGG